LITLEKSKNPNKWLSNLQKLIDKNKK